MRDINKIIVHCSATEGGNANSIRDYHVNNLGWRDIGYHYVIDKDGKIEKGRSLHEVGAHCKGENHDSIGICLVGNEQWRIDLQFENLKFLIDELEERFGNLLAYPHNYFESAKAQGKTCPNEKFWPEEFKRILANY